MVINVGDFDADGVDDLGVSAVMASSRAGKVYVFSGALIDAVTDTSEALVEIEGVDDYQIGANLSSEIDLDGDGDYDLFAWGTNSYLPELTLAVVYGGSGVSGTYSWSDIDATWRFSCGESSGTGTPTCGSPVTGATGADYGGTDTFVYGGQAGADVDGDGYHDVIAGDKFNDDSGYKQSGRVWGLWGKASEYSQFNATLNSTATVLAEGSSVKHYIGGMVGASSDMDGDGDSELWIYNGKAEALYFFEGGSHLKSGSLDLSAPDATFEDITKEITAISNPGDWTGDGIDDIAISFSGSDAGSSGGAIWLYESKAWSGTYDASAAISGSIEGSDYNGNFGWGTAQVAKDLDGNGSADLLAGDYAYDEDDDGAEGSLHIFYNGL